MKYLRCIKAVVMNDGEIDTTVGKLYEIVNESSYDYTIINDHGERHEFTRSHYREEDYTKWFELVENEYNKDILFSKRKVWIR